MAQQVGNLIFEIIGAGVSRELQVAAAPDILVTGANAYASLLSQLAASLRQGLEELADPGMPRLYTFSAAVNDSIPLFFRLSAIDANRTLNVGIHGYRSLADERNNYISTGVISPSVLNDLASWFDAQGG